MKDTAAKRGTDVHRAAERLLAGEAVQVPEEIAGHVEAYARFIEEFKVEPVHVEFSCVSYKWGYAGTGDLCAWIQVPDLGRVLTLDDLKTSRSGIFGETALQLAGYRYADVWVVDGKEIEPPPVDHCFGIHVRGDGYDLIPVEVTEQEFKDYLYAGRIGQFVARSRDLIGAPIAPATSVASRLTEPSRKVPGSTGWSAIVKPNPATSNTHSGIRRRFGSSATSQLVAATGIAVRSGATRMCARTALRISS